MLYDKQSKLKPGHLVAVFDFGHSPSPDMDHAVKTAMEAAKNRGGTVLVVEVKKIVHLEPSIRLEG